MPAFSVTESARPRVARVELVLATGEVPPHHVRAVREVLFQHGAAVGALVGAHREELTLVMPTARWSAAPLLLLRHLAARRLTFVPVDGDRDALERVARRVGTALPDVRIRPCLARDRHVVPPEAFPDGGRHALFVPWCPKGGPWDLSHLAPVRALVGPGGCLLAGVQLREGPVERVADAAGEVCRSGRLPWPADLRPTGVWCDSRQAAALVLLEEARVAPAATASRS